MAARRPSSSKAAQLRRQQIVDSARDLLREREAAKVIVVDIAVAAGVSPATVYNLVGTRDEVMRAVLEDVVDVIADRVSPPDPHQPIAAITTLLRVTAEVLTEDATAYRRAIGAMGDVGETGWLQTTIGELIAARLAAAEALFDQSISVGHIAELIHIGYRGVLISWSYGQLPDNRLATTGTELALHVLGTTARAEVAAQAKRRLIELAKETA